MNKKILFTVMSILVLGGGALTGGKVVAKDSTEHTSTLVQKIADKFGLKKEEVQAVFNQQRSDKFESRLSQLVANGKITEAQKQVIIGKHQELRQAKTKIDFKALKDWATQNGIEVKYLMGGIGMRGLPRHLDK